MCLRTGLGSVEKKKSLFVSGTQPIANRFTDYVDLTALSPVDVAVAERMAEVAATQLRTNGAARPIDRFLSGKCGSVLLQAELQFEDQVVTAQLPTGGATQPRSTQVGAHLMLHNERRFGQVCGHQWRHHHQNKKKHPSATEHTSALDTSLLSVHRLHSIAESLNIVSFTFTTLQTTK